MTLDELMDRILTIAECGLALKKQELEFKKGLVDSAIKAKPDTEEEASKDEPEVKPETTVADSAEPSYDELKAKLTEAGIEVKPRTKYTTLVKMVAEMEAAPKVEEAIAEAEVTYTPETTPEPEAPVAEETPATEEKPTVKFMTKDELRAAVGALYEPGNLDHRSFLVTALREAGVERACDLQENGDCEKVLAKYKSLRGM